MRKSDVTRFWSKVDKSGDCWVWTGYHQSDGYGRIRIGGRGGPMFLAHRVSWQLQYGDAGELFVCHRCDNPRCVNPGHLFLGTAADNNADRDAKGRASGGSHPGEKNPAAKLTTTDVAEIRFLRSGGLTLAKIGALYGVRESAVSRIVAGKRWATP